MLDYEKMSEKQKGNKSQISHDGRDLQIIKIFGIN